MFCRSRPAAAVEAAATHAQRSTAQHCTRPAPIETGMEVGRERIAVGSQSKEVRRWDKKQSPAAQAGLFTRAQYPQEHMLCKLRWHYHPSFHMLCGALGFSFFFSMMLLHQSECVLICTCLFGAASSATPFKELFFCFFLCLMLCWKPSHNQGLRVTKL